MFSRPKPLPASLRSAARSTDLAVLLRGDLARRPEVKAQVADEAFEHVIDGFELTPVPSRADYLLPTDGRYQTELARRIAREGVLVP